jgi:hypothetical protein
LSRAHLFREALVQGAYDSLMLSDSWRLAFLGHERKRRICMAFVDAASDCENEGEAAVRRRFRENLKDYGVSIVLIVFLFSVCWDILWYWFTHRKVN